MYGYLFYSWANELFHLSHFIYLFFQTSHQPNKLTITSTSTTTRTPSVWSSKSFGVQSNAPFKWSKWLCRMCVWVGIGSGRTIHGSLLHKIYCFFCVLWFLLIIIFHIHFVSSFSLLVFLQFVGSFFFHSLSVSLAFVFKQLENGSIKCITCFIRSLLFFLFAPH